MLAFTPFCQPWCSTGHHRRCPCTGDPLLTSLDSPWDLPDAPSVELWLMGERFCVPPLALQQAVCEGEAFWGYKSINNCNCLLREDLLGAQCSAEYCIKSKESLSASENACQILFTDLYFDHVVCLCKPLCIYWGFCTHYFFNNVSYRLNKTDFFFVLFSILFVFSDKFWFAQVWKYSAVEKRRDQPKHLQRFCTNLLKALDF